MRKEGYVCWREFSPSEYDLMLSGLGRRLEDLWTRRGFRQPEIRLRLLLVEAVNNAWEHGNGRDPTKTIVIRWWFDEDFHLRIEDEGLGFDPDSVPDPSRGEALVRPRGRGVFLIRTYADEAQWLDGGHVLHLRLARNPKEVKF